MSTAILHDSRRHAWLCFGEPERVRAARRLDEVRAVLEEGEAISVQAGLWIVAWISYEAAPAFDPSLTVRLPEALPLAWIGLFAEPSVRPDLPFDGPAERIEEWTPSVTGPEYRDAVARIHDYIAAGDTYQVNLTYRMRAPFVGDARALFAQMAEAQRADYGAWVDTDGFAVCSASPELFFELEGGCLRSRPMKGTARRGRTPREDRASMEALRTSAKERAENVMIVDMMRHDMGRIAETGSVRVEDLFAVEKYPTVWQMTSTVACATKARWPDVMAALFPCASVTGAPRRRTMEIIAEIETTPRGLYCGTIGFVEPRGRAQFAVAIRTAVVEKTRHRIEYGVGGGIVADSTAEAEEAECRTKARVLDHPSGPFRLLETLLWRPDSGYWLVEEHMERLSESAAYFDFRVNPDDVRRRLAEAAGGFAGEAKRVRLLAASDGAVEIEAQDAPAATDDPVRVCWSPRPVDETSPFLFHKTTVRDVYRQALAACPGFADVLLWNRRGELTESCIANVVVELDGRRWTPPVECGLLPGVFRGHLLRSGAVAERVIRADEVSRCTRLWLVNSVRGEREARLVVRP